MKKVLCVCFGNTCRSPLMQALLARELGNEYVVESAGSSENARFGEPANENSVLCMQERGIDITSHTSRHIGNLDLGAFTHFVCVDEKIAGEVYQRLESLGSANSRTTVLVANAANGGVPNPYQKGLLAYRECLATLDAVMPAIAAVIKAT